MPALTPAQPDLETLHALHFEDPDGTRFRALPADTSHFEFLGLPRRLGIDTAATQTVFYALSRKFHPDYHGGADEDVRRVALERTAALNAAWRALRDPQPRAEYLLSVAAPDIKPGKNAVPPELLEDLFDIQEAGEELRAARLAGDGAALDAAESRVAPLRERAAATRAAHQRELESLFEEYDASALSGSDTRGVLARIRTTIDQLNYLRTVLRNLR
ncbi:MAG: hypothetical protein SF028_11020 [Candidatus Sumerlaeia bacterium]|nr:hypothetical protein [Candidatus Sumerlaeia bacterium]